MLHEKVQTTHAVVAQLACVALAAAVKFAMRLMLRTLGCDVGAPVAAPQRPRNATTTPIRRRPTFRFATVDAEVPDGSLVANVIDHTRSHR